MQQNYLKQEKKFAFDPDKVRADIFYRFFGSFCLLKRKRRFQVFLWWQSVSTFL